MIHRYKNNGYNIVLDVNSGSVHVVDETFTIWLDCSMREKVRRRYSLPEGRYQEEDIKTALEECAELKKEQMLFTEDVYEKAINSFKDRPTVVKALCLHNCPRLQPGMPLLFCG